MHNSLARVTDSKALGEVQGVPYWLAQPQQKCKVETSKVTTIHLDGIKCRYEVAVSANIHMVLEWCQSKPIGKNKQKIDAISLAAAFFDMVHPVIFENKL